MLDLLPSRPLLIGAVHLAATPGAPRWSGDMGALLEGARSDAEALFAGGCDAVIVENFGDAPFFAERVPAETLAAMALAVQAVQAVASGPVGVNVLRNDARAALGLAAATGADFLRVNVHTGAMLTDQGLIRGRAAETLRERARLCPGARILADVHVKHAVPLADEPIGRAAADAVHRGLADAVVVSGPATGQPPSAERVAEVREAVGEAPILIGSGLSEANARELLRLANGAIVGTQLKREGDVTRPVDAERVARMRGILG